MTPEEGNTEPSSPVSEVLRLLTGGVVMISVGGWLSLVYPLLAKGEYLSVLFFGYIYTLLLGFGIIFIYRGFKVVDWENSQNAEKKNPWQVIAIAGCSVLITPFLLIVLPVLVGERQVATDNTSFLDFLLFFIPISSAMTYFTIAFKTFRAKYGSGDDKL